MDAAKLEDVLKAAELVMDELIAERICCEECLTTGKEPWLSDAQLTLQKAVHDAKAS